jgi:hypothetical protein
MNLKYVLDEVSGNRIMFRDRRPIPGWLVVGTITGICVGILLAASVTARLVFEVRKEQQMIAELIRDESRQVAQGMGLAICEKIMQQHGGRIHFVTGASGTTFKLTLPTEVA